MSSASITNLSSNSNKDLYWNCVDAIFFNSSLPVKVGLKKWCAADAAKTSNKCAGFSCNLPPVVVPATLFVSCACNTSDLYFSRSTSAFGQPNK